MAKDEVDLIMSLLYLFSILLFSSIFDTTTLLRALPYDNASAASELFSNNDILDELRSLERSAADRPQRRPSRRVHSRGVDPWFIYLA
jgi:hypothetical protein